MREGRRNLALSMYEELQAWAVIWCVVAGHLDAMSPLRCLEPVCSFELVVRWGRTMTYSDGKSTHSNNVIINGTELKTVANSFGDAGSGRTVPIESVHTADGYSRNIIEINGQYPGPTIEVMEGAEVAVKVQNELTSEVMTVHWNGLSQLGTPWMDGVPYMSQCPILPHRAFTYRFLANPAGAHWYHSHMRAQRLDGLYGAFLVHRQIPVLPPFAILVTDYLHVDSRKMEVTNPHERSRRSTGEFVMVDQVSMHSSPYGPELENLYTLSGLINGRGRYRSDLPVPRTVFPVTGDQTYRFYVVNAAGHLGFRISVDGHHLVVVSGEAEPYKHLQVDFAFVFPGESLVFDLTPLQTSNNMDYWVRALGVHGTRAFYQEADRLDVRAILTYGDPDPFNEPQTTPMECTPGTPCVAYNCPGGAHPHTTCVSLDNVNSSIADVTPWVGSDDDEVVEHILNMASTTGPSFNNASHTRSIRFPMDVPGTACNLDDCDQGCDCSHVIRLPFNKTIQLVLTNYDLREEGTKTRHHSIHLHGHNFAVLKYGYPTNDATTGMIATPNPDIDCQDALCRKPIWRRRPDMNLHRPAIKSTVAVPSLGYTVVRFRSVNPGRWLLQCHSVGHFDVGLALVLEVAPELTPPMPQGFPTCDDFDWSTEEFRDYMRGNSIDVPFFKLSLWVVIVGMVAAFILGMTVALVVTKCCKGDQQPASTTSPAVETKGYRAVLSN